MKILVTGCRGFVGGSVGLLAAHEGHHVLGISRASQADLGWQGDYLSADVVNTDLSAVIRDFNPDAIFHAVGTASVGTSFATPLSDLRASLLSWANLLDSVRRSDTTPLVVFPSSAAVYGELRKLPVSEAASIDPISPYGFHKAACELLAREYATCFGQRIILCRLFSLFGERQRRLLVWELFEQFASPESVVCLEGTGEETRDYLSGADVAGAILSLIGNRNQTEPGTCVTVNLASGQETAVLELANLIKHLVASSKELRFRGIKRPGDPARWQADVSRLREMIPNWKAKPLKEGLADCVRAWQQYRT